MKYQYTTLSLASWILFAATVKADGPVVDKIYHPYVLPLETEVEWRFTANERNEDLGEENHTLSQRLGYGFSLSENVTIEGYMVGVRSHDAEFRLESYELEVRWMVTEQGEYAIDWGMLFEIEKQHKVDNWEVKTGILAETEIGKSSITANLFALYEFGETLQNEFETEFTLQYRYRLQPSFQPAVELYAGEDYFGVGPAFMGAHRFEKQKQIKWEAGFIFGLNNDSSDNTIRIAIEYEY